jgi:hypothetical protein
VIVVRFPVKASSAVFTLTAYLITLRIRAHRFLARIDADFFGVAIRNMYALEAAAERRWRALRNIKAPALIHLCGGSSHGAHLTPDEMGRWLRYVISGLGIAEGIWAVHYSIGGRVDFHVLATNGTQLGGPLFGPDLLARVRALAREATEDLNLIRVAAGRMPIAAFTIDGQVYYPDMRSPTKPHAEEDMATVSKAVPVPPGLRAEPLSAPPADSALTADADTPTPPASPAHSGPELHRPNEEQIKLKRQREEQEAAKLERQVRDKRRVAQ